MLKQCTQVTLGAFFLCIVLSTTGCNKLKARHELNNGVRAYKEGRYEDATAHFQNAVRLDANLSEARVYLATTYRSNMRIPESDPSPERSLEQFQKILQSQPDKASQIAALKGIASAYVDLNKFDDAKDYQRKVLEQDPADPVAYYDIGAIDWTQTFMPNQALRTRFHIKPNAVIAPARACAELRAKNQALVKEGIDMLNQAIKLPNDYDDAMAYLNLIYRQKADIDCGDPDQRARDLKTADSYVEQAMAVKRRKAEEESKEMGVVLDQPDKYK